MKSIVYFLLFQIQWWLCVLHAVPFFSYGYFVALAIVLGTLYFNPVEWAGLFTIVLMTLSGVLNDMVLRQWGIFIFSHSAWLIVLWLCFAVWFYRTTWLHEKYFLTPFSFMMLGPLSYFAGSHLGAIQITPLNNGVLKIVFLDWLLLGLIFVIMAKVPSFLKKR